MDRSFIVIRLHSPVIVQGQQSAVWAIKREYKGRKPTAMAKANEVLRLDREGVKRAEIARQVGIGRASVYRILAEGG